MNKKKKIILPLIITLLMIIGVIGITYAFFNYTRTGQANTIAVGRIYFNHEQGNTINITNVFPITSEQAQTDTTNAKTLSITVTGDTDYDKGIEYLLTLDSVNNTVNNKKVPINLEVSVTGTGLGTEETGDYYTNRDNYTTSKYKIEYNDKLEQDRHILVGYIAPNTTKGTIEGINGTINIKAYLDADKIAISDTYDGSEGDENGTTTNWVDGRVVLTTEEWNSFKTTPLSFKIKVEANEGIWVEKETTPASCFTTSEPVVSYVRNPNMDISACISKFTEMGVNNALQEGETLENFCNGTGRADGATLQEVLDNNWLPPLFLIELESAGIIKNLGYTTTITDYDDSCGSDVVIPSKIKFEQESYIRNPNMDINTCVSKFTEMGANNALQEGETLEAYCNGTGTLDGFTLQQDLDDVIYSSSNLAELETAEIIVPNTTPVQANVTEIAASSWDSNSNTYIGSFANKGLTSVTIPNSVIAIGTRAFSTNSTLTSLNIDMVNIPDNFAPDQGISTLTNLEIGNHVQTIGNSAFVNNQLTSVAIPNSIIAIGNNAFANNSTLTSLNIDMTNIPSNFASNQGISTLTNLEIGNNVQTIGENAFINNQLTSVNIPNNVTTNLCETVAFDSNVNIIKNGQALYCTTPDRCFTTNISNNSVTITDYDTSCGTDVKIPNTISGYPVTTIAEPTFGAVGWTGSFANKGLTSVTIPNSVTSIGNSAFFGNNIYDAVVPNSVLDTPWTVDGRYYYCKYFDGEVTVRWNDTIEFCQSTSAN